LGERAAPFAAYLSRLARIAPEHEVDPENPACARRYTVVVEARLSLAGPTASLVYCPIEPASCVVAITSDERVVDDVEIEAVK
jgi:hypothetical protein